MSSLLKSTVRNFNPFNASMTSVADISMSDESEMQNILGNMIQGRYNPVTTANYIANKSKLNGILKLPKINPHMPTSSPLAYDYTESSMYVESEAEAEAEAEAESEAEYVTGAETKTEPKTGYNLDSPVVLSDTQTPEILSSQTILSNPETISTTNMSSSATDMQSLTTNMPSSITDMPSLTTNMSLSATNMPPSTTNMSSYDMLTESASDMSTESAFDISTTSSSDMLTTSDAEMSPTEMSTTTDNMPKLDTVPTMSNANEKSSQKQTMDPDIYGTLVGRSIEDFYGNSSNGATLYTSGIYEVSTLSNAVRTSTGSTKYPSLFVLPNTRIEIVYKSGKTRVVDNDNVDNDLIYVDTTNVKSITVSKLVKSANLSQNPNDAQKKSVETFDVDFHGVTFSFFDLLILLIVGLIIYYFYTSVTETTKTGNIATP